MLTSIPSARGHRFLLTFHGLGEPGRDIDDGEDAYWLDPQFFKRVLDLVSERRDVAITFDDANASDFEIALPALEERRLRATFFLVTRRFGAKGCLSREQALGLRAAGMSVGSHGLHHKKWGLLREVELRDELNASKRELEDLLGEPISEAACPFGSYNRKVVRFARSAGYAQIFTSDNGPTIGREYVCARNTIVRSHSLEDVKRKLAYIPRGVTALLRTLKLWIKRWR